MKEKVYAPDRHACVPFYAVSDSFEIVYRKSSNSSFVLPHTHDALEIYFTLTDLPNVLLNDTVSGVPKCSLIIIPPYCVHQLYNQEQIVYERYIISVNYLWLSTVFYTHPTITSHISQVSPFIVTLTEAERQSFQDKLRDFLEYSDASSIAYYADFFGLLATLDKMISQNHRRGKNDYLTVSKSQDMVNRIIAYINEHLQENITLNDIAAHFYMNKDYLARLFKQHTHSTIGHYIALQKVSKAQNLLTTGLSVAQVQEQMGFTSYEYFFRFFKKMTGMSPSQYRKNHRNNR